MVRPYNPSFTYTRYPFDFDDPTPGDTHGLPTVIDLKTPVKAEIVNRQKDSILAIEAELGIKPSGTYGTVRARLDALEARDGYNDGYAFIDIRNEGISIVNPVSIINFIGNGVSVVQVGDGEAEVTITGNSDGYTSDGYCPVHESLTVTSLGQTVFILSESPWSNSLELFIEGIKQEIGDYSLSGQMLTWSGSQQLQVTDIVEVYYSKVITIIGVGTGSNATVYYQEVFTATPGQVDFTLLHNPVDLASTELFISGVSQTLTTDYTLSSNIVTYVEGIDNPSLIGGEIVVIKYFENYSQITSIPNLEQVLSSGNDANYLSIDNLSELHAGDGYFSNNVVINGKLTVDGLIDPTGLVLTSQVSNPTTPESGKATLWYRTSDGYCVISDELGRNITLNGSGSGSGGGGSLSETLAIGNVTDGHYIEITEDDRIYSDGSFVIEINNSDLGSVKTLNILNNTFGDITMLVGNDGGSSLYLDGYGIVTLSSDDMCTLSSENKTIVVAENSNGVVQICSTDNVGSSIELWVGNTEYNRINFIKINETSICSVLNLDSVPLDTPGLDLGANQDGYRWGSLYAADGYFTNNLTVEGSILGITNLLGFGGSISILSGDGSNVDEYQGGNVQITSGDGYYGGLVSIYSGEGFLYGGDIELKPGDATSGLSGRILLLDSDNNIIANICKDYEFAPFEVYTSSYFDSDVEIVGGLTVDNLNLNGIITETVGNVTIDKTSGRCILASGNSTIIVTNNYVTENSMVFLTIATSDLTTKSVIAVSANGSFTIIANAAATSNTNINFLVINN